MNTTGSGVPARDDTLKSLEPLIEIFTLQRTCLKVQVKELRATEFWNGLTYTRNEGVLFPL